MSEGRKTDSSLVRKLGVWHLFRLFSGFIWLDGLILILVAAALLYTAESRAAAAWQEDMLITVQLAERNDYSQDSGTNADAIQADDALPHGLKLPDFLAGTIWPEHMSGSVRRFVQSADLRTDSSFWHKTGGLVYRIWIIAPDAASYRSYSYPVGHAIQLSFRMAIFVLIMQAIYLLSGIGSSSRRIRHYLRPIAELTQSARQMNEAAGQGTVQFAGPAADASLSTLMGKIESISISDLDQKIAIDTAQSELKDLAEAINAMLDRINEAYRSQVRFVSDASHELRTPIAVIQGYANLLDRWGKDDPQALAESVAAIKSETQNMRDLVEQLLFLARSDNRTMQLVIEQFSLSDLAAELIRETEMIDPEHHFVSVIETAICTKGDKQLIKQMLRIFIDNSTKYTPAGEQIQIKVNKVGQRARIVIQDSGIGIPPDDIPHVFDRFYRADDSRARKTGGTGLGLAIAKWIIDRHGGNVTLLSRQDIGTRITVELPFAE